MITTLVCPEHAATVYYGAFQAVWCRALNSVEMIVLEAAPQTMLQHDITGRMFYDVISRFEVLKKAK